MSVSNIRRISVQLGAEVNQFVNNIGRAERSLQGLSVEMRTVMRNVNAQTDMAIANLGAFASRSQVAAARMRGLSERIRIQSGYVRRLNAEYSSARLSQQRSAAETARLEQNIIRATTALQRMNNELIRMRVNNSVFAQMSRAGTSMMSAGMRLSIISYPLIRFIKNSIQASMSAEELQNKVNVAFGSMAREANSWADNIQNKFGIASTNILEYASSLNLINRQMGMGEKTAAKMSKQLTMLAFDISSLNEKYSFKEAFEKLRSGITGEALPLLDVGVNVKVAELKKFGIQEGIIKEGEEITGVIKQYLIYRKILEDTKLTQNDFARTIDSTANQTKIAAEQFAILEQNVGDQLKTAFANVLALLIPLLNAFNNATPEFKKFVSIGIVAIAALGPVLLLLGMLAKAIGSIVTFAMRAWIMLKGLATALSTASNAAGGFGAGLRVVARVIGTVVIEAGSLIAMILGIIAVVFLLATQWEKSINYIKALMEQLKMATVAIGNMLVMVLMQALVSIRDLTLSAMGFVIDKMAMVADVLAKLPLVGSKYADAAARIRAVVPAIKENSFAFDQALEASKKYATEAIFAHSDAADKTKEAWDTLKMATWEDIKGKFKFDGFQGFMQDYDPFSLEEFMADLEKASDTTSSKTKEIENTIKSFTESIKNKAMQFRDAMDIFTKPMMEKISGERLLVRLEAQKEIMEKWKTTLLNLREKLGEGSQLFQTLLQKGPGSTGELVGLSQLSDEKLAEYSRLYGEKSDIALGVATGAAFAEEQAKSKIEQIAVNLNGGVYVGDMGELANMIARQLKLSGVY